jgi:calcium-translocating P-type ATPase
MIRSTPRPVAAVIPDIAALAAALPRERLEALRSGPDGLSEQEAARRLREQGPNEPVPPLRARPALTFLANFTHTLALLLWFAAGLAFAAGIPELGAAIVAVVVVNGVFAFVQEYRAERIVASLMRRVAVRAMVRRGGVERRIPATDLVPGDVVRLAAGDVVPADCALLSSDNLSVDLSVVTGESVPVERTPEPAVVEAGEAAAAEASSFVPSGSSVVTGLAEAVVYATGYASTMGRVAAMVEAVERGPSVLESQVAGLSRLTAVIAVIAGAATLIIAGVSTEVQFLAALTFATGVIVPEGLLPTLSVSLAIGARRMAERGAAVRRLSAVEAVGSVTVICTDKTGTLTQNRLSVSGFTPAVDRDGLVQEALAAAALCNDARAVDGKFEGDPIDVALAEWAAAQGVDVGALRNTHVRIAGVPFSAERRYMTVTVERDGRRRELIKGAPEAVLALSGAPSSGAIRQAILEAAGAGERVLMLAARTAGDGAMTVLGLVEMHDPPRPEVPEAIGACQRASVRVVMLTGDHPATARSVARAVGLGDVEVVEGSALDGMGDSELLTKMRGGVLFARIDPRQKLRIVSVLRHAGEIVVVTGDGINDAPALRASDVGVAMGLRGTEVAKQSADIVLADDNFATIVAAIEEGRSIKSNIRRFASYVFTSNVAELAPFLLYIFSPVTLPLAVAQVLAIDLGTDLVPALALGVEAPSARTMDTLPEPPKRPLLTRALAVRTFLFFGLMEAALGLVCFFAYLAVAGWRPFDSFAPYDAIQGHARTLTFLGIVSGQVGCVFAQRDGRLRDRLSLTSNAWIAWGLVFELVLALVLVYVPGLNRLFSMRAVSPAWLLTLPLGAAAFIAIDLARRRISGSTGIGGV